MSQVPHPGTLQEKTQTRQGRETNPGLQWPMETQPFTTQIPQEYPPYETEYPPMTEYKGAGKLLNQYAVVTGGDSGIGRAVAVLFAREGCDVAIVYLEKEQKDAQDTKAMIEAEGRQCLLVPTDVGYEENCLEAINHIHQYYPRIDVLVNNAGMQVFQDSIEDISAEQLERTFRTNVFGYFYMVKACLPLMNRGSKIINCTSVTAYKGTSTLVDYSSTKGAEVSFTRSLALQLAPKGIRVNGVAPGPIHTPLQPASRPQEGMEEFVGGQPPLGRVGQPSEVATCFVFLASSDSSYMTGQVLHPNGGTIVNG
ncbi:hypothetical protein RCL1_002104 [Eukaryota sp. TZLM3-RCL]